MSAYILGDSRTNKYASVAKKYDRNGNLVFMSIQYKTTFIWFQNINW